MSPYAGSPALAPEAREKVLQTFRHTLALAQEGRNEEALLGCDFLMKMDARFAPARSLLEMLRGVAPGTPIDVETFSDYLAVESAGEALPDLEPSLAELSLPEPSLPEPSLPKPSLSRPPLPDSGHDLPDAFPSGPASSPSGPRVGRLDDLVFADDEGNAPGRGLPEAPKPESEFELATSPEPAGDPPGGDLDDLSLSLPAEGPGAVSARPAPAAAPPPASAPAPAPSTAPPAMPASVAPPSRSVPSIQSDPRITQFLKQGDEALARGKAQEAIDLWSRVFLIDLSNEDASRRIDAAREAQAESARKIDMLLSEGVTLFENGDLAVARSKFLEVLAVSENDATARGYLNQIEAALAPAANAAPAAVSSASESEFMKHEIEAPGAPSFAMDSDVRRRSPETAGDLELGTADSGETAPVRRRGRVDVRVLLGAAFLVLAAVAGGTYWFLRIRPASRSRSAEAPLVKGGGPPARTVPSEDAFPRAQALFDAGKIDEAIAVLAKLPESDPRHNEALVRIEKMKFSAAPTPGPAAPSAAVLDEMRVAGLTAMSSSRYIDALKNLDPVVKARPLDTEAAAAAQRAHEQVEALRSASKSYNEGDYDSAIKLLWELRRGDPKNQDVEEYLVNAYYNAAVQSLQAGNIPKAVIAVKEATDLRPGDAEAQRLLLFARKYPKGATDLLSRILIKNLSVRN